MESVGESEPMYVDDQPLYPKNIKYETDDDSVVSVEDGLDYDQTLYDYKLEEKDLDDVISEEDTVTIHDYKLEEKDLEEVPSSEDTVIMFNIIQELLKELETVNKKLEESVTSSATNAVPINKKQEKEESVTSEEENERR